MTKRAPRKNAHLFGGWNPLWDFYLTGTEMALAAAQVVGYRSAMLTRAGLEPTASERREFLRMGNEKVDAAHQSFKAMHGDLTGVGRGMAHVGRQQMELANAVTALTTAGTLSDLASAQQRCWQAAWRAGESVLDLWVLGLGMATKGMLPLHAKATANARRLALVRG